MLRTRTHNTFISPAVPVDKGISYVNLGLSNYGFQKITRNIGDIDRSISVSVYFKSASGAFENNPVGFVDVSTSAASLRGVSWVNSDEFDVVFPCYLFECHSEQIIRHSFNSAVAFPMQSAVFQPFQVFNSDETVILFSQIHNFITDFITSCFNKTGFMSSQLFKFFNRFKSIMSHTVFSDFLKFTSSNTNISLFIPNIPSHVELFEDSAFFVNYADTSECSTTSIDSDNCVIVSFDFEFFEDGNQHLPFIFGSFYSEHCCVPSISEELVVSSPSSILGDRQTSPSIQCRNGNNWVAFFGFFNTSGSGDVVWDGDIVDSVYSVVLPNCKSILNYICNYLGLQSKTFFDVFVFKFLQVETGKGYVKYVPVSQCFKKMIGCFRTFFFKFQKLLFFFGSQWKDVQFNCFYYFNHNHSYKYCVVSFINSFRLPQFLPPLKGVGFLEAGR